jgi:hypothetical protein
LGELEVVSFLNGKQSQERCKDKVEAPTAAAFEQSQNEIDRLRQQVSEQDERINRELQQQVRLKDLLTIAEGNLNTLQIQKHQAEREALQSQCVQELREIAREVNDLSWQLGLALGKLQARIGNGEGLQLRTSKRFFLEPISTEMVRRSPCLSLDWLPYVHHEVGSDQFLFGSRGCTDPKIDRLAELRKSEKQG